MRAMKAVPALILLTLVPFRPCVAEGRLTCPLHITFIDVGEGDATMVRLGNEPPILIDAANPPGAGAVTQALQDSGVTALDALIVTHPHLDHSGGVFEVLRRFPPERMYDNGQPLDAHFASNDMYRWYVETVRRDRRFKVLRQGQRLEFGEMQVEVVWPPKGALDDDWNKNSLVLLLRYGAFRALLMGDALMSTEAELLSRKLVGPVSILKVGHHGSKFASGAAFLEAAQPKLSLVSVNRNNVRGYPNRATQSRLARYGHVLRTDIHGTVQVCAKRDGTFDYQAGK